MDDLGLPQCSYQGVSGRGQGCGGATCPLASPPFRPTSLPPPTNTPQACYLDWALQCDPSQACCQHPEDLVGDERAAAAACANRTAADAVCDFEVECYTR